MKLKKIVMSVFSFFGGWMFYILASIIALIGSYRPFADQLLIAGVVVGLICLVMKESSAHIARGLILLTFCVIFFKDYFYYIATAIGSIFIGIVLSTWYEDRNLEKIVEGFFIGIIGIAAGWYGSSLILNLGF